MSSPVSTARVVPPRAGRVRYRLLRNAWGLTLVILLAPLLAWASPLVLLFLLWPALVVLNPLQPAPTGMTRLQVLRDVLLLFLYCLPLLGLLRGAQVGPWLDWGPIVAFANGMMAPGVARFGPAFIPWADFLLGSTGVLVALGFAFQDALWRGRARVRVDNLPLSRIADLQPGLVRVQGRARPLYDEGSAILYYLPPTENGGEARAQHNSFHLEDDTGRVVVDTTGACFTDEAAERGEHQGLFDYLRGVAGILDTRCSEIVLPRNERVAGDGRREWTLGDGDPVYLVGYAQPRFGEKGPDAELVIRPQTRLFGSHFHQLFYLTNGEGRLPAGYFRHGLAYAWLYALVSAGFCAWLASIGWQGTRDFEAAYGYEYVEPVAVEPFRQDVIPLAEREAQVPGYGLISVAEMLDLARRAPAGQLVYLLRALESLNAQEPVVPLLKDIVRDDTDPARRHIAQGKLRAWGERVPQPSSQFAALYLGGERVPVDSRTAGELLSLAGHTLGSCEAVEGGQTAWAERDRLTDADRLFFRLPQPREAGTDDSRVALHQAGFTLQPGAGAGEIFAYGEKDFFRVHRCNASLLNALWCHSGIRAQLRQGYPDLCRD